MKRILKRFAPVGAAIILTVPLGASAQALAKAPAATFQDAAAAQASDLASIAQAKGWTLAQARAQHEAGERISRVRQAAAAVQGEAVIGGVLAEQPGGTPTLLVKGKATDKVRSLATAARVQVVDGQPYTAAELRTRASAVHDALLAMGYREVATGVNPASAGVLATVTAKGDLPATRDTLKGALALKGLGAGVALTVVGAPAVSRESNAFGGMRTLLNGTPSCTSGWSVVAPNGTTGVSSAGHCANNQITHDGTTHTLSLQAQHIGILGDVEWGTTTVTEPDDFFVSPTTVRDVSAVEPIANITVNETVCVFGRTTLAQRCTTVVALDVEVTDSLGTSERLVAAGDVTQGGDSGAPWYNGNVAFGSHVGKASIGGQLRSVFQVADLYDEALDVRVRTS